jgi:hypothetical protein
LALVQVIRSDNPLVAGKSLRHHQFILDAAPRTGHYFGNPELLALPRRQFCARKNVRFGTGVLGWAPVSQLFSTLQASFVFFQSSASDNKFHPGR